MDTFPNPEGGRGGCADKESIYGREDVFGWET